MEETMVIPQITNKIYAKLDDKNVVIGLFSSVFELPKDGDVLIEEGNEEYHAHVHLKYALMDAQGRYNYKYINGTLVERAEDEKVDLEKLRQEQASKIEQDCKDAIVGGFKSSAYQKTEKTYATTLEDQSNITGNALSATSKIAGIAECQNDKFSYHAVGEDFVEWTAEECLQLARDFKIFKETQLVKSKELQNYISTLSSAQDITSVTWDFIIPAK
jgi:hypothetical protein